MTYQMRRSVAWTQPINHVIANSEQDWLIVVRTTSTLACVMFAGIVKVFPHPLLDTALASFCFEDHACGVAHTSMRQSCGCWSSSS